tara:strand:- start:577 stop:810 length:234 start_codon:yes stop_codon:yes gene_type:complete
MPVSRTNCQILAASFVVGERISNSGFSDSLVMTVLFSLKNAKLFTHANLHAATIIGYATNLVESILISLFGVNHRRI